MDALVPDDLWGWAVIEPLLPPEPEKLKGGGPRSSGRAALAGIIMVLRRGMQRKHLPRSEVGCSGKTDLTGILDRARWDAIAWRRPRVAGRLDPG